MLFNDFISLMYKLRVHLLESRAVKILKGSGVVAIPTDTVYGLACDATDSSAIEKLYNIKQRHKEKPLAICISEADEVAKWGNVDHLPRGLLEALLPGPVTLVLQCLDGDLDESLTLNGKVAMRVPDYPFIRSLARDLGRPLALTSANLSNAPSAVNLWGFAPIWEKLDEIFDGGDLGCGQEASTIVDLSLSGTYFVIREGAAYEETVKILREFSLKPRQG
ncbi:hypothetical protein NQ318_001861 [Aromia moschata]|uniref:Threonylcarbamoyl-AMP synthase n=1 Tax=Aromia moschata TaxID=1265417 RepID=A0AAV8Z1V6_9CUCU|nr:hypothetical protein NQ318_001861 [Aromia moschata]